MSVFRRLAIAFAIVLAAFSFSAPVGAQSLEWRFKSEHPNVVDVELYSMNRDHTWPGGNEVYT